MFKFCKLSLSFIVIIIFLISCSYSRIWSPKELDLIKLSSSLLERVEDDSISNISIIDDIFNPKSTKNLNQSVEGSTDQEVTRVDMLASIHPKNPFLNYFKENFLSTLEAISRNKIIFKEAAFVESTEIFERIINTFSKQTKETTQASKQSNNEVDKHLNSEDVMLKSQIVIFKLSSLLERLEGDKLQFEDNTVFNSLRYLANNINTQMIGDLPHNLITKWFEKVTTRRFIALIPVKNEIYLTSQKAHPSSRLESGSLQFPTSSKSADCFRYSLALTPLSIRQIAKINKNNITPCLLELPVVNQSPNKIKFHLLTKPYGPVSAFVGNNFELNYYGLEQTFNDTITNYSFYDIIVVLATKKIVDKIEKQQNFIANNLGVTLSQVLYDLMEETFENR